MPNGTQGLTLLVSAYIERAERGEVSPGLKQELTNAFRKLEAALGELAQATSAPKADVATSEATGGWCQCEHAAHPTADDAGLRKLPRPHSQHHYRASFAADKLTKVSTIYGEYVMCLECAQYLREFQPHYILKESNG